MTVGPCVDACGLDQKVGLTGLLGQQNVVHGDRLGITLLVNQHAGLVQVGAEGGSTQTQCDEQGQQLDHAFSCEKSLRTVRQRIDCREGRLNSQDREMKLAHARSIQYTIG